MASQSPSINHIRRQQPSNTFSFTPDFIADHEVIQYEISFWFILVSSPLPVSCLPTFYLLGWCSVSYRESLNNVQALFSNSQNISLLSTMLTTNPTRGSIQAAIKKVNSIPARPRTNMKFHLRDINLCLCQKFTED